MALLLATLTGMLVFRDAPVIGAIPFEGVWCDVLGWLQEDPDASAVALLGRLQETEPDRFSRAHLRTLQQWRGIMADKMVYAHCLNKTVTQRKWLPQIKCCPKVGFT